MRNIRLELYTTITIILLISCATKPPKQKGFFKSSDLVEIVTLDSSIHLDIRYATSNNFVGQPVYSEPRAFLQRPAAEALVKVNNDLKAQGYGLLVFDAYRPWSITKKFWQITPKDKKQYVASPRQGSRHNRGCAVDLSLYDLSTGRQVKMPSEFDDFSESSYAFNTGLPGEIALMRDLLRNSMEKHGFRVLDSEWWHFDYKDWNLYRVENIQFSEIK